MRHLEIDQAVSTRRVLDDRVPVPEPDREGAGQGGCGELTDRLAPAYRADSDPGEDIDAGVERGPPAIEALDRQREFEQLTQLAELQLGISDVLGGLDFG